MSIIEREQVREVPAELDEVGRVLLRAAVVLRERGWIQGSAGVTEDGGNREVCALGAISVAARGFKDKVWACSDPPEVVRFSKSLGGAKRTSVWVWNDRPGRTAEEVAEALERAAYFG